MQHLAFLPVGLQVRDESGSTMSDLKSTGFQNKMELLIFLHTYQEILKEKQIEEEEEEAPVTRRLRSFYNQQDNDKLLQ